MTTSITLRSTKGSALTHDEMDTNLTNLQTTADAAAATAATLTADKAEAAALGVANTDQNMGSFTGSTISDNVSAKAAIQALETAVETKANASAVGVTASAANMGTYTGATIPDNETAKQNLQSLETAVETKANASALGVTSSAADMGTFTGTTIADSQTAKQALQALETAVELRGFTIETYADIAATTIPAIIDSFYLQGYTTVGDGGGAQYKRVGSEPAHEGKAQSADTAWWELTVSEANAKMFGALGDNDNDDLAALSGAAEFAATKGVWLFIPSGIYLISDAFRLPDNCFVRGAGMGITIIKVADDAVATDAACITNENNTRDATNAGNSNIVIQDLTADCNGRRVGATYGSSVELSYVTDATLRRVEAINGYWHCIDITSADASTPADNETYQVGPSSGILVENCVAKDPYQDDAITTHYSYHITFINTTSLMTGVQAPSWTQHGLEIDEGTREVRVFGGRSYGFSTGLQVKGHDDTPAASDVTVIGYVCEACSYSFQIEHSTLRSTTGRNVALINCKSILPVHHGQAEITQIYHLLIRAYDNVRVENFACEGDAAETTDADVGPIEIGSNARNTVLDGIFIKNVSRPSGAIRVAASAAENIIVRRVHALDCYDNVGYLTNPGVVAEDWYAETTNVGSPKNAVIRTNASTLADTETRFANITANGGYLHAVIDEEALAVAVLLPLGDTSEFSKGKVIYTPANSSANVAGAAQKLGGIGYIKGNQNIGADETVLFPFMVKNDNASPFMAGFIGLAKTNSTDGNTSHDIIIGTRNNSDGGTDAATRVRIDANGMLKITGSLSQGAPVTKTADFTVAVTENYLINNKSGSSCTATLPAASSFPGREITIKTIQAQTVVSASSNVIPLAGGAAGTAILAATAGKWAKLVSNGTNWEIMAAG